MWWKGQPGWTWSVYLVAHKKIGKARVLKWHANKHFVLWTFLPLLFLVLNGVFFVVQVVLKGGDLQWVEWESELWEKKKKKDWILVQFASFFSFTCLVLALLLAFCFLPRVLFGLVLLRGKRQVESTCVCLEDCKGIHCMCNKSSKTRDKGGRACSFTWWFCVFFSSLLLFHFLEGSWREWKKKVWNVLGRVLSCWY